MRNSFLLRAFLLLSMCSSVSCFAQKLKIDFVTAAIVRVQYAAEGEPLAGANNTGVVVRSVPSQEFVKVGSRNGKTVFSTDSLLVEVDDASKAITFRDRKTRKVLLMEDPSEPRRAVKVFTENIVYDESSAHTVQTADGQKVEKNVIRRDTVGHTWQYDINFCWQEDEALYGLGCHIEDYMNLRGHTQYLTQHNLKATVPVLNSTNGYGLLFDAGCAMVFNPEGSYDKAAMHLDAARQIDYYFIKGSTLDEVVSNYRFLTGECPMMPRYLFGYTQSKERYCSQQEVIDVLKEYRKREIPIDMIVQDWNYWPEGWGYMHMDPKYYPDPMAMAEAVHDLNARLMVSIWPNPQYCPQADDFKQRGFMLEHSVYDAFSQKARDYYWSYAFDEFFSKGFDAWWCDCSEPLDGDWKNMPEGYGHDSHKERWQNTKAILTEALGAERSSLYSLYHSRGIYENQRLVCDAKRVVNLTRSSYAGQQRYSTITWNGDTYASWDSFRKQIPAGLNFMATGCPYWSVDVGSFFTKKDRWNRWFAVGEFQKGCDDPAYREYYTRMFQWATFLPMLRSHGTDTPREIWRFGEPGTTYYEAILKMIRLRYELLPYTYSIAARISREGYTMSRLLAFDFAKDPAALDVKDEFMFGPSYLVCPVTQPGALSRSVYLPKGTRWYDAASLKLYDGGQTVEAECPIDRIPLFVRQGSIIPTDGPRQYADQPLDTPTTITVFAGADATFTLYYDAGDGYAYERGEACCIPLSWNDKRHTLTIGKREGSFPGMPLAQSFYVQYAGGEKILVNYSGKPLKVNLGKRLSE